MPRDPAAQAYALGIFDKIWQALYIQCSQIQLGEAGQNCINDRKAGACKWHQTGQPEFPGQPAYGACWNWFNAFRDPIANDPNIGTTSVASAASGVLSTISQATGLSSSTLLLVAAGLLIAMGVSSQ